MTAHFDGAAATDPGRRPYNEDAFLIAENAGLYLVCDGVGGREAGEVASKMACEVILDSTDRGSSLKNAIADAHLAIRDAISARSASELTGMASTVVALQVSNGGFTLAWTGDSRGYLWDGAQLWGLTRDHSLVEALVARGELTRNQVKDHPQQNVILSALGGESDNVEIGTNRGDLPTKGTFLLCSDGLTDSLTLDEICKLLAAPGSAQERASSLAELAREQGGRDNITVLLVDAQGDKAAGRAPNFYEMFDPASGEHSWSAYVEPDDVEQLDDDAYGANVTVPRERDLDLGGPASGDRTTREHLPAARESASGSSMLTNILVGTIAAIVLMTLATLILGML